MIHAAIEKFQNMGQIFSRPDSNDISSSMSESDNDYSASHDYSSNSNQKSLGLSSMLAKLEIEDLKLTEVDFEEIKKAFKDPGKYIGKGAYGKVYGDKYQGKEAVAKICKYSGSDMKKYILNEINWLSKFNHHNIVKIHAFAHKPSKDASGDGTLAFILEHGGDNLEGYHKIGLVSTPSQPRPGSFSVPLFILKNTR